jgi:hypothetical protein
MKYPGKDGLQILQHSLGVNEFGEGTQYRNHFCAGGKDLEICREMVVHGYMAEHVGIAISAHEPWFNVTPAGKAAVRQFSQKRPKLSRAKRRYKQYLKCDGIFASFGDFLCGRGYEMEGRADDKH